MIKLPKGITTASTSNARGGVTIYLRKSLKRRIIDGIFHGEFGEFVLDAFGSPVCFNKLSDIRYAYESYYRLPHVDGEYKNDDLTYTLQLPLLALIAKNYNGSELVDVRRRNGINKGEALGKIMLRDCRVRG